MLTQSKKKNGNSQYSAIYLHVYNFFTDLETSVKNM